MRYGGTPPSTVKCVETGLRAGTDAGQEPVAVNGGGATLMLQEKVAAGEFAPSLTVTVKG
jgi:hypothetical protein